MQVLQYVITYQEVMTHTRAYRARPRSEKLSAAEAVETNPGKTMPAGEHKSLATVGTFPWRNTSPIALP